MDPTSPPHFIALAYGADGDAERPGSAEPQSSPPARRDWMVTARPCVTSA